MSSYHRPVVFAGLVAVGIVAATPARAHHNDWGAPLIGGALGGYALGTLVANSRQRTEDIYEPAPSPDYYAPAPTYAPTPSAGSIEYQLNQLDKLAAGGYITPQEYQARRNSILNQL
jgi:hypothetical protein